MGILALPVFLMPLSKWHIYLNPFSLPTAMQKLRFCNSIGTIIGTMFGTICGTIPPHFWVLFRWKKGRRFCLSFWCSIRWKGINTNFCRMLCRHWESLTWPVRRFALCRRNLKNVFFAYCASAFALWNELTSKRFYAILKAEKSSLRSHLRASRYDGNLCGIRCWPHLWPLTASDYPDSVPRRAHESSQSGRKSPEKPVKSRKKSGF